MKSTFKNLTMTVAALAIATGVAGAQSFRAEIPFAFQVGGKVMAPGTYTVRVGEAHHMVMLANYGAKETAMVLPGAATTPAKAWVANGSPMLAFDCGIGRCALARIWTGSGDPALTFPHRSLGKDMQASLTEVRLTKVNGD